ncbi:uncharacterized protein DNG_05964 [Cephalotrichum gorgonifer]|uniref:Nucleoporin NUP37 n=1 Tax=Cephalotrichum gorgonifer TaxID=2041049 RepID=A0AAE8N1V2_9PEZI|nr:uncharacterized protein DNG_05964 [Cephalotrichum gorgonifer]
MSTLAAPRIRRTAQNIQFTHNVSRRVNDVKVYPVLSPQGATIIIYGHENGVTLLWRGGRRFKPSKPKHAPTPAEKRNGAASDDSVMIIDSDEDEPAAQSNGNIAFVDKPEFEDEVADEPYPEIIQTLDLSLGTAGLHVAVLPMPPAAADDAAWGGSELLKEKLIFAVSCANTEVYLFTLPLTPPSPESKARPELRSGLLAGKPGSGVWGESMVLLGGQSKSSRGLALTLIKSKPPSPSLSTDTRGRQSVVTSKPRAVVTAHNLEASGTLRLWDVSLDLKVGVAPSPIEPFQTEYLPSPLSSISFNTTHMTQLLTVFNSHAVRIYDYAAPSITPDELSTGPFPSQGSWLLSLYPPFARNSTQRKPVVDAAWISHGRAILVLLADGMWGIWDVDGASPSGTTVLGKSNSGIVGAAITSFSVSGYIEGTSPLRAGPPEEKARMSGDFVPMTPHSRKDAQASLSSSAIPYSRLASTNGGISVVAHPVSGAIGTEESVALWIGSADHVCVIPGINSFWSAQTRRSSGGGVNLFSGAQPTRMVKLHDLNVGLLGERCCGVNAVVDLAKAKAKGETKNDGGLGVEVLISGETRLVALRGAEDGPGRKIGGVVGRRRFLGDANSGLNNAIIVHPRPEPASKLSFNLNSNKFGSVRGTLFRRPSEDGVPDDGGRASVANLPTRSRAGLAFAETISVAADRTGDATVRNVENEMLELMDIDRSLADLEDMRDSGAKRVFFEDYA